MCLFHKWVYAWRFSKEDLDNFDDGDRRICMKCGKVEAGIYYSEAAGGSGQTWHEIIVTPMIAEKIIAESGVQEETYKKWENRQKAHRAAVRKLIRKKREVPT